MKNNVVGQVSKPGPEQLVEIYEKFNDGQCKEIRQQLKSGHLTMSHIQALIEHRSPFEENPHPRIQILSEVPKPCSKRSVDEQVAGMRAMYEQLGWAFTESGLIIPKRREGFDRLIIMADTSLTNNKAFKVCKASFSSWRYVEDLDLYVPAKNDERHPSRGTYAIWFMDDVESDSKWKNHSLDMMNALNPKVLTRTLLEHEVHELAYHRETGKHLDPKGWTLLSGSRDTGGRVPCADWRDDRFRVSCADSDGRSPFLGPREAVSL